MKKLRLVWLVLLTIFCVGSVFAQQTSNKSATPCENYGKKGFEGEAINLNLVNAELKELLNFINEKNGCNFVVDKLVGKIDLTVNIDRVPWNIALDAILRSQDLGRQIIGKSLIRIAKVSSLSENGFEIPLNNTDKSEPLYTEFIKLNRFQSGTVPPACNYGNNIKEKHTGLSQVINKMLSRRGAVEADSRSNSLIITDTREKIDEIVKKVREWDNSNLTLEEIIKDFGSKNK